MSCACAGESRGGGEVCPMPGSTVKCAIRRGEAPQRAWAEKWNQNSRRSKEYEDQAVRKIPGCVSADAFHPMQRGKSAKYRYWSNQRHSDRFFGSSSGGRERHTDQRRNAGKADRGYWTVWNVPVSLAEARTI